ncbi:MAG: tripartite tricarboxylate transporter substrate binding protein [Xanthobacteraceae bacterium]
MKRRNFIKYGLASAAATTLPIPAFGYPDRPIKLVVPFSAGGVNDIVGRQWAERVKAPLGTVYVENVPGGGGTIGVMEVKRAEPDGHTVLFGSASTMVLNEMTRKTLPYDPKKDFVPIAIFCVSTSSIVVNASVPVKNVKELIAYVKANAGKLSYGSAGTGTMSHLSGELFKQITGLKDIVHIPYKGAGPGIADIVSGHIPIMTPNVSGQILTLHKSGKIRILAVNAPKRLKAAPEIPTAIEEGVPNMVGQLFLGIYARAGTPDAAVEKIAAATQKALAEPQFEKALIDSGFEPVSYIGAEAGRRYMAEEYARWKPVVDAIGLKV